MLERIGVTNYPNKVCRCGRMHVLFAFETQAEIPSGAASDFIKPFVSRYGYPDLDQVRTASKYVDRRFCACPFAAVASAPPALEMVQELPDNRSAK